ncbi:MAG: TolC family protein [Magnetococcales bacterium]|nr:TolC family protein [Magnetococcales bacterium]
MTLMNDKNKPASKCMLLAASAFALMVGTTFMSWAQGVTGTHATVPRVVVSMGLQEFIAKLRANNKNILSKKGDANIAATGIDRAAGAFQPIGNASVVRGMSRQKNTFEEELTRQGLGTYEREGNDFSVGVTQLVAATGAKLEGKVSLSRSLTNTDRLDPLRPTDAFNNRSGATISLTQPLARDAGNEVTEARLNVARLDTTAAKFTQRDTETNVVAEAVVAYYELVAAQQRVTAEAEKIRTGERLLNEAQNLRRIGRLAESDIWEVENSLARYKSAHSEALQNERERGNRLRTMLLLDDSGQGIRASDDLPTVENKAVDFDATLRTALERRDDFQMRKVQVEREGIQLAYSKNQALPRIDLVGSYGLNGLEYTTSRALAANRMSDYPSWTLGLQISAPLGTNLQAESDLKAAQLRREDALLNLKAVEVQIANDLDTALAMRTSMVERWNLWHQVQKRETRQLAVERSKFAEGRSDMREILLREERVVNVGLSLREQQVGFARAQTVFEAAQGTLMDRFR